MWSASSAESPRGFRPAIRAESRGGQVFDRLGRKRTGTPAGALPARAAGGDAVCQVRPDPGTPTRAARRWPRTAARSREGRRGQDQDRRRKHRRHEPSIGPRPNRSRHPYREGGPFGFVLRKQARCLWRDAVVAAPRALVAVAPLGLESAVGLEAVQRRIQRSFARRQGAAAPLANALCDLVAVQFALAQHAQDEQGVVPLSN